MRFRLVCRFLRWIEGAEISLVRCGDLWHMDFMQRWLLFGALLVLLVAFRLVGAWQGWMNVSPLPVLVLLSLVCFHGRERWLLPLAAWVVSDPLLNLFYDQPLLVWDHLGLLMGIAATTVLVPWMKASFTWLRACAGAVLAAVLFYAVTNAIAFFALPEFYARTWEGFWQAQWTGPVGLGPTWIFLRNACAANLLFTVLFLLALRPQSTYLPARLSKSPVR